MPQVMLATEDELSEAVCIRLLADLAPALTPSTSFRKGGYGYLRANIRKFAEIAQHRPLLLLTDLDSAECPKALTDAWLGNLSSRWLLFRVAVREIESWLLADHDGIRTLFGPRIAVLPPNPEQLPDPKAALIKLARRAPRQVREDLLPVPGGHTRQGLGYNRCLSEFVRQHWNPVAAETRAESLARTRQRLKELAAELGE